MSTLSKSADTEIVPDVAGCRSVVGADDGTVLGDLLNSPALGARIVESLRAHAESNRANSRHAKRAIVLTDPPSFDRGEITDKGTINQGAVLRERDELVTALYSEPPPDHVLIAVDRN